MEGPEKRKKREGPIGLYVYFSLDRYEKKMHMKTSGGTIPTLLLLRVRAWWESIIAHTCVYILLIELEEKFAKHKKICLQNQHKRM